MSYISTVCEREYYLLKCQCKRGTFYKGRNNSGYPKEMLNIPIDFCYTNPDRVRHIAEKYNGAYSGQYESWSCVQVPKEALIPGEYYA